MNKPLTMIIKDTQMKLAKACNESGLPYVILDLILQGVHSEVHALAERDSLEEEMSYAEALKKENKKNKDKNNVVVKE